MKSSLHAIADQVNDLLDGAAFGTAGAAILGWVPHVAAILSVVWFCIRIYDRFKYGHKSSS